MRPDRLRPQIGQLLRFLGPQNIIDTLQRSIEHDFVEEENRAERLLPRRRRNVSFDRKIREELTDFGLTHLQRMSLSMKKNELPGPEHIGILGADAVMQSANTIPHLVEKL